jgi:uncharacterized membrane protein YoaK (UPF0700 family)
MTENGVSTEKDIAVEYFKALRNEIDLRTRNQAYFTISKIVVSGVLLGHLVQRDINESLFSVPLIAILLDFIIHHNLAGINAIGKYIKDEIEGKFFLKAISGGWTPYETKAGQTRKTRTRDLLDRFGQLGITTCFFLVAISIYVSNKSWSALPIWLALGVTLLLIVDFIIGFIVRASGTVKQN